MSRPTPRPLLIPICLPTAAEIEAGNARLTLLKPGETPDPDRLLARDTAPEVLDRAASLHVVHALVFDTVAEARAAATVAPIGTPDDVGMLPDGEGVFLMPDIHNRIDSGRSMVIHDQRAFQKNRPALVGSWDMPYLRCEAALDLREAEYRPDRVAALFQIVAAGDNPHVLRDLQVAIEQLPGAYVGFVAVSPEDIRDALVAQQEATTDLPDATLQPYLLRENSKSELGSAHEEVIEGTLKRLMEQNPDLFPDRVKEPAIGI